MRKLKNEELDRKTLSDFKSSVKFPVVIILDNVRSMNNIGSIFRTADAFLVEKIFLCGITATPPHRDIQKTALGSTESVEWEYFENVEIALHVLKSQSFKIVAIEQTNKAVYLNDHEPINGEKLALIFGNEVEGVSNQALNLCDYSIEIPQFGVKHSLNISVSVGIVLWDIYSKLSRISN